MSTQKARSGPLGKRLKQGRDYWLDKLAGVNRSSNLRLDYPRPADGRCPQDALSISLSRSLLDRMAKLTGNSPLLIYALLMAALKISLFKHTSGEFAVVGSPSLRRDGESAHAPNALAIVDRMDGLLSFRAFLLRVRESLVDAYERQDYPYERLIEDLRLSQAEKSGRLFDIALSLEGLHDELPALDNDITIRFAGSPEQLSASVAYNNKLFRRETIEAFAGHYLKVLDSALSDLHQPIWQLEMLEDAERRQILSDWNKAASYAGEGCIHRLFEAQVERTADAIAVGFGQDQLSYGELNRKANQLARHLKQLGVGPEMMVGICLRRSVEMLIGLLGVLKAGGAYVPLDPDYPNKRLAYMLKDAQAFVVLTDSRLAETLPQHDAHILRLDADWQLIARQEDDDLNGGASPDHLAYVIYTSGSTGDPKGVTVQHAGICNLAQAQSRAFGVRPSSRVLQFASFSFDASVSEIFMALTTGAALYLTEQYVTSSPDDLAETLERLAITTITLPPVILSLMPPSELPALRSLIVAGESCPPDVFARWQQGRRCFNAYGPTEVTVCGALLESAATYLQGPPIGRPLDHTQTYLLDRFLQLVPVGVTGEIYIGGAGLARGYLNNPEMTAAKLIPNALAQEPGGRLYKTGDLARYLPDGNIEFAGRIDQQIKLRGYRIELAEIEATLSRHPGVRECVVAIHEETDGEKRIIAYMIADLQPPPAANELQSFLRDCLPEHMIPSAFVELEAFPLTPNGKVDRKALPPPGQGASLGNRLMVEPRSLTEKKLAEIWRGLLKVDRVSVHDHFFDLGGHSLLATQLISRVREAFQVEMPLQWLFTDAPTVEGIANSLDRYIIEQAGTNEIAGALDELNELSDDEVRALLYGEQQEA